MFQRFNIRLKKERIMKTDIKIKYQEVENCTECKYYNLNISVCWKLSKHFFPTDKERYHQDCPLKDYPTIITEFMDDKI